jgi:hypothetical protein
VRKALNGFCGIKAATTNAATAMLHQGSNKQAAKLNKMVSIREMKNFIVDSLLVDWFTRLLVQQLFIKTHFCQNTFVARLRFGHHPQRIIFSGSPLVNKTIVVFTAGVTALSAGIHTRLLFQPLGLSPRQLGP